MRLLNIKEEGWSCKNSTYWLWNDFTLNDGKSSKNWTSLPNQDFRIMDQLFEQHQSSEEYTPGAYTCQVLLYVTQDEMRVYSLLKLLRTRRACKQSFEYF